MGRRKLLPILAILALVVTACGVEPSADSGPDEGIQVHGHWEIDVYNEDGTLDYSYDFENALLNAGQRILVEILGDGASPGHWIVHASGAVPPCGSSCGIPESSGLAVTTSLTAPYQIELSGSFVASQDGDINWVGTTIGACDSSTAHDGCFPSSFPGWFSGTEVSPAKPIESGQQVQVTVTFTFS